jgi:hypothetical protein
MTIPRTVAEVLARHVTMEIEGIDRMYLNLYVPILQEPAGVAHFWIRHRGHRFASSSLMSAMTKQFLASIEKFAERHAIPVVNFEKGVRKEDIAKQYLAAFAGDEGVLFIGKAQEKARVVRTERRYNERGQSYPWLVKASAFVNYYYFYIVDRDFGPLFIKLCSYFPYNGKVCLNGHEYLKRQLARRGIAHEALDNGLLSCAEPATAQRISDGLSAEKIEAVIRKWLRRLPHPFTPEDRRERYYCHDISILQCELSLTQVLDRPVTGRVFFEEIIRDNLDLGRPDQVQLIFDRRANRRTPGRFRTRVITDGVVPSLHIDYKATRIKQYHKEGRALRTETTINDTRDFGIGRRLKNLPALREVGFKANRRLLDVQRISHDCSIGEDALSQLHRPALVGNQRAPCLRFGDPRVLALFSAIAIFRLLPDGFTNRDLREHVAPLLGLDLDNLTQGRMTYDLRRLRLHGLIERVPRSRRYQVTPFGFRAALFLSRSYNRLLRPGLSVLGDPKPPVDTAIGAAYERIDAAIDRAWNRQHVAA